MAEAGLCGCGCGGRAPIAKKTRRYQGHVKGRPQRFIHNHHWRKTTRYTVESCGYTTPCWVSVLATSGGGYVREWVDGVARGAHLRAWETIYGPIADGLVLDHLCRVRNCVRPDHLEPVTQIENVRRGLSAKLSGDQVVEIRALEGKESRPEIAARFGISAGHVWALWRRKAWQ